RHTRSTRDWSSDVCSSDLVGGWSLSSTVKITSGAPFYFRSGTCNVPGQFREVCIPGILPGANPFAQSLSDFDPNKPLFNVKAFRSEVRRVGKECSMWLSS